MQKAKKSALAKRFHRWLEKSWIVYAAFAVTVWILDHLPLGLTRFLGQCGGAIGYHLDTKNVNRAMQNLAIAFPQKTEDERAAILKACYLHLGTSLTDVCHFRSASAEELLKDWIVRPSDCDEVMQEALAEGKGVIGIGGHIGFWELSGFAYPAMGFPCVCVANRLGAPKVDEMVQTIRGRLGNVVVHQEGALIHLLRALKQGKTVGLIMDHWGTTASPIVPFFGKNTRTIDTVARLHRKTGAPIISNLMIRRQDGRYVWRCKRIHVPPGDGVSEDLHIRAILLACNRDLESVIRDNPEQWTWMHKRWR